MTEIVPGSGDHDLCDQELGETLALSKNEGRHDHLGDVVLVVVGGLTGAAFIDFLGDAQAAADKVGVAFRKVEFFEKGDDDLRKLGVAEAEAADFIAEDIDKDPWHRLSRWI
jgi:hypothetical protein